MLDRFLLPFRAWWDSGAILRILGALLILVVGYIVALLVQRLVVALLRRTNADNRLARWAGGKPTGISVERAIGSAVFWLIMLFVIIAFLNQLNLTGITGPLTGFLDRVIAFIPRLLGAIVIVVVGYLLARVLRQVVTNLAARMGLDRVSERAGVRMSLSNLAGTLVYALILIPTLIAALNTLNIAAISGPATAMLQTLLNAIPGIFAAALLLFITYFIAKLVSGLVTDLLSGLGLDDWLYRLGVMRAVPTSRRPSQIIGTIVMVAIMLFAAMEAADLIGFQILADIIARFMLFAGRLLIALVIFLAGMYLANLARELVLSSGNTRLLASIARSAVLIFAGAMALRELGLADEIVNLAFGLTLGAIAVAAALAFGLGGREIASRELGRLVSDLREGPRGPAPELVGPDAPLTPPQPQNPPTRPTPPSDLDLEL
jgi:hypothetical protein